MTLSYSILLACLWAIAATVIGILPSRDHHWRAAYGLIAVGIPILGYVTWENGPMAGIICFAAGASILRWPLIYAGRWLRRTLVDRRKPDRADPGPGE